MEPTVIAANDEASATAALESALAEAVSSASAPGAVALIGGRSGTDFAEAFGWRQVAPEQKPATLDTLYDLASLTKVVATTTAVLLLWEDGVLDLDLPASDFVPFPAFKRFTLRQLLTHTSGLVAGKPYYKEATSIDEMLALYAALPPEWPAGNRWRYSDAGFMILGRVVELAARDSLDAFCRKRIFKPLGMERTGFKPPAAWTADCAATENCPWRGKLLRGEVHDENAYAVGGVSGHAGLFSNAGDLGRFCRGLLSGRLLKPETIEEMTRLGQVPFHPSQGLGWWLDSWTGDPRSGKSVGFLPVRAAFGMSGWTGTSLWMDRSSGRYVVLLSNTCHPSRAARDNDSLRRTFHTAVARRYYPGRFAAHTGLDRLVYEDFAALRGKRIGLLTHHAAVDQFGRHILDVLALAPDVFVQRLYSPEHGFQGTAEAGAKVASSRFGAVPVISLYGDRKAPSPEELESIDCFVVDLQDVGSRYYTYVATMKDCLAACARAGKPVLILDRPNPVGGEVLEGPIATVTDRAVCWGPVPVRHGMTLGELATFFALTEFAGARPEIRVSAADGWPRAHHFRQCDLPWVAPSPNMPSPETALLYVGTCLFEGTNLNEGRGTDTPFAIIGAPWLDAKKIVKAIAPEDAPGCRLLPVEYTPRAIAGKASNPVYRDQKCEGVRIEIRDPHAVRAFTLATALLTAIRREHGRQFEWKDSFDVLAGSDDLRRRIESGQSAAEIVAAYAPALEALSRQRPRLYA
jgi:uncharacterized protein YbbC (DUF1343 family)/CubicO group peptidase (beta-lactamase class C family)